MKYIGRHVSIKYGMNSLGKIISENGETAFQIFAKNPRSKQIKPVENYEESKKYILTNKIKVVIHAAYPAMLNYPKYKSSINSIINDFEHGIELAGKNFIGVVVHPGTIVSPGIYSIIAQNVKLLIKELKSKNILGPKILLETMANEKKQAFIDASTIRKVFELLTPSEKKYVGICVDTCHLFINNNDMIKKCVDIINEFGQYIYCVHSNDSASLTTDRHADLFTGLIPYETLKKTLQLLYNNNKNTIFICETSGINKSHKDQEKELYDILI